MPIEIADEKLRFIDMINKLVSGAYAKAKIPCPGPGAARKLRRRFYRLRDSLADRTNADKCNFHLNGAEVIVELKPEWKPQFNPGAVADEPRSENQGNGNHKQDLRS